ncbi:MAG: DHHA1 domain-containing protein, partial [Cyanobacteria bacterium J06638_6]
RLGPRINAVGRISEPQIVIDLLTSDDVGVALERAMQCEQINATRQELCQTIEQEAIAWCEQQRSLGTVDIERDRVLVVVQPGWHHGVIGIVASRLVERYGVPVFIGTYEDDDHSVIRGSARGIPEFDVFAALQTCHDLMEKFGGHRAAGGFSFLAKHLRQVTSRLSHYACQTLSVDLLKPLVKIDSQARLDEIDQGLFDQIDHLHPCGIENPDPVFWTPNLRVLEQQTVGRNRDHLKLVLGDEGSVTIKAIAWRWGEYYPLPDRLDVAYKLKQNEWQGTTTIELELVGVRPTAAASASARSKPSIVVPPPRPPGPSLPNLTNGMAPIRASETTVDSEPAPIAEPPPTDQPVPAPVSQPTVAAVSQPTPPEPAIPQATEGGAEFSFSNRRYTANTHTSSATTTLTISNFEGQRLVVNRGDIQGWLYSPEESARPVDLSDPDYGNLVRAGKAAFEIQQLTQQLVAAEARLAQQEALLAEKDARLAQLQAEQVTPQPIPAPSSTPPHSAPAPVQQAASAVQPVPQPKPPQPVPAPTAPPPTPLPPVSPMSLEAAKQQVRQTVGDPVWFCLSPASQKDLAIALAHLATASNPIADSAPLAGLATVLERELLQPLLSDFTHYGDQTGDSELIAMANDLAQAPGLSLLPPLLSETWKSLSPKALTAANKPRKGLYQTVSAEGNDTPFPIDDSHRVMLDEFLQGWDHPIARWLTGAGSEAASDLAQVAQIQQADNALPLWQGQLMQHLVLGQRQKKGILQKIFG